MKTKLFTFLLVIGVASIEMVNAGVINGTCGDNLTWTLNTEERSLVIEGSGPMTDYIYTGAPWHNSSTYIDGVSVKLVNLIKTIIIKDGVTSIGNHAFRECDDLRSVTIGNDVTSIGGCAFIDCKNMSSPIVIPNSVTSIGNKAFYGCSSINSITIGNNVSSIGEHAFYQCGSLSSINIPDKVTNIGQCAFAYCGSLTSITIGKGVTNIGALTFYDCKNLKSVVWNAKNCSDFEEDNTPFYRDIKESSSNFYTANYINSVELGNEVETIPAYLCYNMRIKSIIIPSSVTSIREGAFRECSLTSVTIPNSVTSIERYAFTGCSGLTSVTIGSSVTAIRFFAFSSLYNMQNMYVKAVIPPSIYSSTFNGLSHEIPVYVPKESVDAYKADQYWGQLNIIGGLSAVETVESAPVIVNKVLRDGQIFIIRGDKTYTVQGQEVK